MANNKDQELALDKAALRAQFYNVPLYEALKKLKDTEMSMMEQALYAQQKVGRTRYKLAKSEIKLQKYQEQELKSSHKVAEAKDGFIPKVLDRAIKELEKVKASIRRQKRKIEKRERKLEDRIALADSLKEHLPANESAFAYLFADKANVETVSTSSITKPTSEAEPVTGVASMANFLAEADQNAKLSPQDKKVANIVMQAKKKTFERQNLERQTIENQTIENHEQLSLKKHSTTVEPSPLIANHNSNPMQDLLNTEFYSHEKLLDLYETEEEEEHRVLSEEEKKALAEEEARQQALALTGGLDPLQSNPYLNFITNRNSINQLHSPAPNDQELEQILHAASRAPDHGRLKPYHFTIFKEADKELFTKVIYQACAELGLEKKAEKYATRAPMVIIVSTRYDVANIKVPQWEQLITAGCATYGLQLAATALGYDNFWSTGKLENSPTLRKVCQVGPHDQIVALLFIGTAQDKKVKEHKKRLENLLTYAADLNLSLDS